MARSRPFANIRKLPSEQYQARYYHLGKQVPAETTLATKVEARAHAMIPHGNFSLTRQEDCSPTA